MLWQTTPLVLLPAGLAVFFVAIEVGFRLGLHDRGRTDEDTQARIGALQASTGVQPATASVTSRHSPPTCAITSTTTPAPTNASVHSRSRLIQPRRRNASPIHS
jgi:hypothetical protein